MTGGRLALAILYLGICFIMQVHAENSLEKPLIVLDPGHTLAKPGALGVRGIYEVNYNDQFVAKLAKDLREASFMVSVTRLPDQSISLLDRATIANDLKPILFLSIHHDSAQLKYLKKIELAGRDAWQTITRIGGFSIFVSKTNPQFDASYRFAELLGKALVNQKRAPSLHHAEKTPGENRELLEPKLGIYQFDDLVVLKKTKVPAVLLEIGVIVDEDDERYVSAPGNQYAMRQSIVKAIQEYSGLRNTVSLKERH